MRARIPSSRVPIVLLSLAVVLIVAAGTALGLGRGAPTALASSPASPAAQTVRASGIVRSGQGTCFPDAVLVDCEGDVIVNLKAQGGAAAFAPYYDRYVQVLGTYEECVEGGQILRVSALQMATNPCGASGTVANVVMRDNYFDPATLNVPVGTTVRWTNRGAYYHTTTSSNGYWDSGPMGYGAVYGVTFYSAGTFNYYCRYHPSTMRGTVVVGTTGAPTPTPQIPPTTDNLARGKPVYASSALPGHPPSHAVDGDGATFWASAPGSPSSATNYQHIYVDLQATYDVSRLHMIWTPGRAPRGYAVYRYHPSCGGWCYLGSTSSGDGDDTLTLSRPAEGRYFLLSLIYPQTPGTPYELREWEIFGAPLVPPSTTNVAAGRPAYASSQQPGYEAGKATDANLATEWRSAGLPAYIYVDLGRVVSIDRAILRWSAGRHATRYALYAWNGVGWNAVYATSNGTGGDETALLARPVSTRFLLLYAMAGPAGHVGLREFEIYAAGANIGPAYPLGDEWTAAPDAAAPDVLPDGAATLPDVRGGRSGSLDRVPGLPDLRGGTTE